MQTDPSREAEARRVGAATLISILLVLAAYVWLVSRGTWTHWPGRSFAYDQLAASFRHGQLALAVAPDPALLALPDPYDPVARRNVPFLRDYSLYNGHYYIYFGPVPAAILALLKSLVHMPIGDQHITFVSTAGIFICLSLLIIRIRKSFFPASSAWTLVPALLTAGLMAPWPWLLTTSGIYTAALAAGQFFFLAGMFAAFMAFHKTSVSAPRLLVAGLLWAAALGSRVSLILQVAFLAALTLLWIFLQYRQVRSNAAHYAYAGLAAILPLIAVMAVLSWYNWARFGSIFETGAMYMLGGVFKWQHIGELAWPGYAVQNLYNYFLNPPGVKYPFPYFFPTQGVRQSLIASLPIPEIYHSQEITGLVFSAPFLVLGLLPVWSVARQRIPPDSNAAVFRWLVIALLGSFLLGAAFFLCYYWAAERYIADFLPGAVLLSMIGMWQVDRRLSSASRGRIAFWVILSSVMAASIILSILLSMSFQSDAFRQLNPVLWRQLSNLFRP